MIKYLNIHLISAFILFYGCSDDPVTTVIGNVDSGDIFFNLISPNFTSFAAYSIKEDGTGKRLIKELMFVTSTPYSGKLTLASIDSGLYYSKMYVGNLAGGNLTEISRNNFYPVYFILSPHADKVLFTSDVGNAMCVVNADGTNFLQLSDLIRGTETVPEFSPDGNYIAYLINPPNFVARLCIINSDGSHQKVIKDSITHSSGASLDWSPDGTKIVFENGAAPNTEICTINTDGTDYVRITEGTNPAWSPDGNKISFLKNVNNGIHDIFMMDPNGSNEINLTNSFNEHDSYPSWSPDSRKILYHTNNSAPGNLKIFDINSISSRILTDSSSSVGFWKR